jgi:hypothetical protein
LKKKCISGETAAVGKQRAQLKAAKAAKKKEAEEERLLLWKEATEEFHAETHIGLKHRKYQHYYVNDKGTSIGKADEEGHLTPVWWPRLPCHLHVDLWAAGAPRSVCLLYTSHLLSGLYLALE